MINVRCEWFLEQHTNNDTKTCISPCLYSSLRKQKIALYYILVLGQDTVTLNFHGAVMTAGNDR